MHKKLNFHKTPYLLNGANARTIAIKGSKYTTLSNTYLGSATTLSIARTMIHELVHAMLLFKNSNNANFSESLKEYAAENGLDIQNELSRFHHEYMGQ